MNHLTHITLDKKRVLNTINDEDRGERTKTRRNNLLYMYFANHVVRVLYSQLCVLKRWENGHQKITVFGFNRNTT